MNAKTQEVVLQVAAYIEGQITPAGTTINIEAELAAAWIADGTAKAEEA